MSDSRDFILIKYEFWLQAAQDGVDIISLSITPNRRPPGIATFFNPIDMALLAAIKAGIFVVQAAGNTGPSPKSISSFSPWIFTVGAATHDRVYRNSITLGNNVTIPGVGLARKAHACFLLLFILGAYLCRHFFSVSHILDFLSLKTQHSGIIADTQELNYQTISKLSE